MMEPIRYDELENKRDFEYYFRFKKEKDNFDDLWRMKSTAREALKEWLVAIHSDLKQAEDIANGCSELIENTIKYSAVSTNAFVVIKSYDGKVVVETVNKSEPDQYRTVRDFIEYINKGDKKLEELYIERITMSITTGGSQLGILKVMMETHGSFELIDQEEENVVHLKLTVTL